MTDVYRLFDHETIMQLFDRYHDKKTLNLHFVEYDNVDFVQYINNYYEYDDIIMHRAIMYMRHQNAHAACVLHGITMQHDGE